MGNTVSSPSGQSPLYDRQTFPRIEKKLVSKANTIGRSDNRNQNNGNQENSRMLFLMYLINRTWNVVVDGKNGKRWVKINQFYSLLHWKRVHSKNMKMKKERHQKKKKRRRRHSFSLSFQPELLKLHLLSNIHSFWCSIIEFLLFILRLFFKKSVWKYFSDDEITKTRFLDMEERGNDDNYSCNYGSECSYCSCGYCEDENCRVNGNYSICGR